MLKGGHGFSVFPGRLTCPVRSAIIDGAGPRHVDRQARRSPRHDGGGGAARGCVMTEAEWMACADPQRMLNFLRGKTTDRKLRLFACGCCAMVWDLIAHDRNLRAVELAGRLADRETPRGDVAAVRASARDATAWSALIDSAWSAAARAASSGTSEFARSVVRGKPWGGREERERAWQQARTAARRTQARLLRDVMGNFFHPVKQDYRLLEWTGWRGGTVRDLAQAAYNEPLSPTGV